MCRMAVFILVVLFELLTFASLASDVVPANLLPASGECGIISSIKAYEGNVTGLDESPWNCLIENMNPDNQTYTFCSCALINQQYVLTTAYCVNKRYISDDRRPFRIVLGEWDKTTDPDCSEGHCAPPVQKIMVSKIVTHPQYERTHHGLVHDIALIRMEVPLTYNDFVKPICLPLESHLQSKKHAGGALELSGWNNDVTAINRKVKVRLDEFERSSCVKDYCQLGVQIADTQFCAKGKGVNDPGGVHYGAPLVATDNNSRQTSKYLVGLLSFGTIPSSASVFTNVSGYVNWVQGAMEP